MNKERNIIFHGSYFQEFYLKQTLFVREKIAYVFRVIKSVERVSQKFLKHIEGSDGLYEIRIEVGSNIYRIFCCFDQDSIVVLFNAFHKKTKKTPKQEIELATKLKNEYFELKMKNNDKERSNKKS